MLLRAAQSPFLRAPRRLADPRSTIILPSPTRLCTGNQLRIFTTNGNQLRKQTTGETPSPRKPVDVVTPAASKQLKEEARKKQQTTDTKDSANGGLLSEKTVGNKEQRKADWAIMKEMVKYLWPKVGTISLFHGGLYILTAVQDDWGTKLRVGTALSLLVGGKVSSFEETILRQPAHQVPRS